MSAKMNINVSTLELYESLRPFKTSELTPRIGYYQILRIDKESIPNHLGKVDIATALWKYHFEEAFLPANKVKIQLETFKNNPFREDDQLFHAPYSNVIHVRRCWLDRKSTTPKIICFWGVSTYKSNVGIQIQKQIDDSYSLQHESDIELANILLDMEDANADWDNYEANMLLDIEEAKNNDICFKRQAENEL